MSRLSLYRQPSVGSYKLLSEMLQNILIQFSIISRICVPAQKLGRISKNICGMGIKGRRNKIYGGCTNIAVRL